MDTTQEILNRLDVIGGVGKEAFLEGVRIFTQHTAAESSLYFFIYLAGMAACFIVALICNSQACKYGGKVEKLKKECADKAEIKDAELNSGFFGFLFLTLACLCIYMTFKLPPIYANFMMPEKAGLEKFLDTLNK